MVRSTTGRGRSPARRAIPLGYELDPDAKKGVFDLKKNEDRKEDKVNGYMFWFSATRSVREQKDEHLWMNFQDAFEDWKREDFQLANPLAMEDMVKYLRENGVFVPITRKRLMPQMLYECANATEFHVWTAEEIKDQIEKFHKFHSRFLPQDLMDLQSDDFIGFEGNDEGMDRSEGIQERITEQEKENKDKNSENDKADTTTTPPTPPAPPAPPAPITTPTPPTPPPPQTTNPSSTSSGANFPIINLSKMYRDEWRYTGEEEDFNGCTLIKDKVGKGVRLTQKGQGTKINLSRAAQFQEPSEENVKALNARLEWQKDNLDRGLNFVEIDLETAKIYVFVDASFANNSDFTSQLGVFIMIGNEVRDGDSFTVKGNLFYWSSIKCKRVTRAVLASELYAMVHGVDIAIAVSGTVDMITKQLGLPKIETVICTDSKSLYECMVKLGTTKEKRLMIDIMALRQSYERREFSEVRWIKGDDNPADALTKSKPNKALQKFVDTNEIRVRMDGWVERG